MSRAFLPLQVVGFIATKRSDPERGPLVKIRPDDALMRLIEDGELVWVYGPRRHELSPVVYDDTLPRGGVVVRDIGGITVTEIVRLVKMDIEHRPVLTTNFA